MYHIDRQKIAIRIYNFLFSLRKTGVLLGVSHSTISRWLKNNGHKKYTTYKRGEKTKIVIEALSASIKANPLRTPKEIANIINETTNVKVSRQLVYTAMKKSGYTLKKVKFFSQPKNLQEKTETFIKLRNQYIEQNKIFLSIDETSFGRNGILQKGYSLKGTSCLVQKIVPRITTTSVVALASPEGFLNTKSIQGSVNTDKFLQFLKDSDIPKDSVILLDNVAFHHSKVIKNYALEKEFHLLFTPPYSPWFNPIEGMFSIVKRSFYKGVSIEDSFKSMTSLNSTAFFKKSLCENERT
jgi:transposase